MIGRGGAAHPQHRRGRRNGAQPGGKLVVKVGHKSNLFRRLRDPWRVRRYRSEFLGSLAHHLSEGLRRCRSDMGPVAELLSDLHCLNRPNPGHPKKREQGQGVAELPRLVPQSRFPVDVHASSWSVIKLRER
jgi:hypothetical protein